ncbi:MAG: hypothetical protein NTV34_16705 [Proteobacteria bacterium]|nr:hypothetical protein [Pseudomonadota bacterium]
MNVRMLLCFFLVFVGLIACVSCKKRQTAFGALQHISSDPKANNVVLIFGSPEPKVATGVAADVRNFQAAFEDVSISQGFKVVVHPEVKTGRQLIDLTLEQMKNLDISSSMVWIYVGHSSDGQLIIGPQGERFNLAELMAAMPKNAIARWFGIFNACYSTQLFASLSTLQSLPANEIVALGGAPASQELDTIGQFSSAFRRVLSDAVAQNAIADKSDNQVQSSNLTIGDFLFRVSELTNQLYQPVNSAEFPNLYPYIYSRPGEGFLNGQLLTAGYASSSARYPIQTELTVKDNLASAPNKEGIYRVLLSFEMPRQSGLTPVFARLLNVEVPNNGILGFDGNLHSEPCQQDPGLKSRMKCLISFSRRKQLKNESQMPDFAATFQVWVSDEKMHRITEIKDINVPIRINR